MAPPFLYLLAGIGGMGRRNGGSLLGDDQGDKDEAELGEEEHQRREEEERDERISGGGGGGALHGWNPIPSAQG